MTLLDLLLALLPTGAYSKAPDADHVLELQAYAKTIENIETRVEELLPEFFADTAEETLEDWERVFDLHPASTATTAERQAALAAHVAKEPSLNPDYIASVVSTFTLGSNVSITEYTPLFWDFEWDAIWIDEWVFRFLVVIPQADVVANSVDFERTQLLVDALKPAHTEGVVVTDDFLFDTTTTPWDWSLYGA